ncbi:MAG: OadG family protein [Epsilonproteobacteria bacterium]|nr:OadG family protein [Campylobacterota bacterium]
MGANLVIEGLKFMVLGMTTVFLFLMLMIFVLNIISKVVKKYFPPKKLKPILARRGRATTPKTSDDNAVVAAIVASIQEFKKQK